MKLRVEEKQKSKSTRAWWNTWWASSAFARPLVASKSSGGRLARPFVSQRIMCESVDFTSRSLSSHHHRRRRGRPCRHPPQAQEPSPPLWEQRQLKQKQHHRPCLFSCRSINKKKQVKDLLFTVTNIGISIKISVSPLLP